MADTGAAMHHAGDRFDRPVLATARLTLRRPAARDADAIIEIVGERAIALCLSRVPHPYGASDARFFLEQVVPHEWCWAITLTGTDDLIGAVGLTPGEAPGSAELGYWLSRDHWGRGLITEAAHAVLRHGIETLALREIASGYFVSNLASGRVLEKLGFVETDRAARPCMAAGHEVPSIEMRLPVDTAG